MSQNKTIKSRLFLLIITVVFSFSGLAFAWDQTRHALIMEMTLKQLPYHTRQKMLGILKAYKPVSSRRPFLKAATWADSIKGHAIRAFDNWHYIDFPYSRGDVQGNAPDRHNVVWAISQAMKVLKSPYPGKREKGFFLRMLLHMVADLHQPMHAISLYDARFPAGDRGGNLYRLKDRRFKNLHTAWDRGFRWLPKNAIAKKANGLLKQYPRSFFSLLLKQKDPYQWGRESYGLAKQFAYQVPYGGKIPHAYEKSSIAFSQGQLVLASYRLAGILNTLYP